MNDNYGPGDLETIAMVHGENMEEAGKCHSRHTALVELLESLR